MSFYEGVPFFFCLLVVLVIAGIMGYFEKSQKGLSFAASVFFILMVTGRNRLELFYFLLYDVISLLLVMTYPIFRKKYGRNVAIYRGYAAAALLPLVLCKGSALGSVSLFGFVGISYLTFRVLQIIIEMYDGVIKEISAFDFTAFLLFFPSISSGPIDRSRRFLEDWNQVPDRETYLNLCAEGIFRLLLGAVYKMVLAVGAYKCMGYLEGEGTWYLMAGYAYAYGLYLFFDFAGYSLMAVGTSYILGIRTPDNFHAPFLAKDIRDFWDRWHISLSHWFRDFIFTRFVMYSARKKWFKNRLNRACVGFFVNMAIMGCWHGLTLCYLLYGLYHGALLAATEVYQKKSAFYKKNKNKKWYQVLSWAVTMQFVMFGFLIFSGHLI